MNLSSLFLTRHWISTPCLPLTGTRPARINILAKGASMSLSGGGAGRWNLSRFFLTKSNQTVNIQLPDCHLRRTCGLLVWSFRQFSSVEPVYMRRCLKRKVSSSMHMLTIGVYGCFSCRGCTKVVCEHWIRLLMWPTGLVIHSSE